MVQGSCLCGAVRYEVRAPAGGALHLGWSAYCHCSMCRKQHGALFGASVGVAARDFRWLAGAERVVRYRSSAAFERPFCAVCGTKVPAPSQRPEWINVPAGTLDDARALQPRAHIFVGSKSPLWAIDNSLPCHAEYPPGFAHPSLRRAVREGRAGAVAGSCLCGAVRYAAAGPLGRLFHCGCARCRRSSGAPCLTFAVAAADALAWTEGAARVCGYALPGAEPYDVRFCERCGSLLPVPLAAEALIPAGSIDTEIASVRASALRWSSCSRPRSSRPPSPRSSTSPA